MNKEGGCHMFRNKKRIKRTILATLLIFSLSFTAQGEASIAYAASTTDNVPITGYTISTGHVITYSYSNGKYSQTGYIDGKTDKCIIKNFKQDGYCQVKYPVKNGYKTAYTKTSNFLVNENFSTSTIQLGKKLKAYRRSNLSQQIGTVYANDQVIVVGISGSNTQVIYPVSGGYKLGWVSGIYGSGTERSASLVTGYYQIKSAINTNYVLDVYGKNKDDGVNVQIYKNSYHTNQVFIIKKQSDGYYTVTAVHSGKLLDVDGGKSYDGVNVQQWTSNGGDNQKWKIVKTSDGYYSLISKSNGLYLDVSGGNAANEVNVQCYMGNSTLAQKFVLQRGKVGGKEYTDSEASTDDVTVSLNVPSYKQYDSRWKNQTIGNHTIGNIGCLLTSCAMKYSYQTGTETYPTTMKGKLKFSNNDLIWSSLSNVGFSYTGSYGCNINNSILSTVYQKLKEGKPVIIGGMKKNGGTHYVVVTGYNGTSASSFNAYNFTINDPNSGTRTNLGQFFSTYSTVLHLVY
jgi:hypothetical protein